MNNLQSIESYIGTFYSKEWVQKNILNMTDVEIDECKRQINKEGGIDVEDGGIDMSDVVMVSQDIHKILQVHLYHQKI